jgi:chromosome segregation ATPase
MAAPRQYDPFASCRDQLRSQVEELETQVNEWRTIRGTNSSSAQWHREQLGRKFEEAMKLKNTLSETCRRVAENPSRFPIAPDELTARQAFVTQMETRLHNIEIQLAEQITADPKVAFQDRRRQAAEEDNQRLIDGERQHQQTLIQQNEQVVDEIVDATYVIRRQAGQIGEEIDDSTKRLAQVDRKMDSTQEGLNKVVDRMKKFLSKGSTWLWIGCAVLTVIVIILLVWVIMK